MKTCLAARCFDVQNSLTKVEWKVSRQRLLSLGFPTIQVFLPYSLKAANCPVSGIFSATNPRVGLQKSNSKFFSEFSQTFHHTRLFFFQKTSLRGANTAARQVQVGAASMGMPSFLVHRRDNLLSPLLPRGLDRGGLQGMIYVAPYGNDAWSGKLVAAASDGSDGPLATLASSRSRRHRRAPGHRKGGR